MTVAQGLIARPSLGCTGDTAYQLSAHPEAWCFGKTQVIITIDTIFLRL